MKKIITLGTILLLLVSSTYGQQNIKLTEVNKNKLYIFETNDGAEVSGKLISFDEKEVLIESISMGKISIPKYQLKSIREVNEGDISETGQVLKDNIFASRYFITTNGLPIKKGDSYVLFNWYGPDLQFGIADNFSIGVMTSWLATPIIGTFKYTMELSENSSLGIGALVGTLGWTGLDVGGALPFLALTFGDRKNNISFSAGYGVVWDDFFNGIDGEGLVSVAGMTRITNSLSFVFDSFIIPGFGTNSTTSFTALLIPGLRLQNKENLALQFGFTGIYSADYNESGGFLPLPVPMAQLYWKF